MKFLKILLLSSTLLYANCSLVNDKFFSKNKNKNDKSLEEEIAKDQNNKPQEEEIAMEKVYIEDDKEKKDVQIPIIPEPITAIFFT